MVFMGEVIGYYFKRRKPDGMWYFQPQPHKGFELMGEQCVKAAKQLKIDYVGFDVVALDKKNFRLLEANSAPAITPEAEETISQYFKRI
jgi:glutathione synthase/RimK-type ligase-like ATP-grasp enzyme